MKKQTKSNIVLERVYLTPELAEQWLNGNVHNRPMRNPHVEFLASEMKEGRWMENAETIKFADDPRFPNGLLIDGQHRCWAVMESGVPIWVWVAYHVSAASFHTIDTNLIRTASDTLGVDGVDHSASVAPALIALDSLQTGTGNKSKGKKPNSWSRDMLKKNPDIIEAVDDVKVTKLGKVIAGGPAAALLCLFKRKDRVLASRFAQSLATGIGLTADDPFYLLREALLRNAKEKAKLPRIYLMAVTIKAWNCARDGRSSKTLRWQAQENFPVIK